MQHRRPLREAARRKGSLESASCAPRKAQWPAAFELRRMMTIGVWQTQANRVKFGSMPVKEFAR
jgi:hypothetical protein